MIKTNSKVAKNLSITTEHRNGDGFLIVNSASDQSLDHL